MSQGQEGDTRPMRRLKRTDYYEAKAALEQPEVTAWPVCENCGLDITGKAYAGSQSNKHICQQCWNEK